MTFTRTGGKHRRHRRRQLARWVPGKLWTVGRIAAFLDVDPKTVARWIDSGALLGARLPGDRHRRVHRDELRDFLRRRFSPTAVREFDQLYRREVP